MACLLAGPAGGDAARLAEIEALVKSAHFHTARSAIGVARPELVEDAPADRARLEVLAATAELALGRRGAARARMAAALAIAPDLALDEATTSPRVVELLAAERRRGAGTRP